MGPGISQVSCPQCEEWPRQDVQRVRLVSIWPQPVSTLSRDVTEVALPRPAVTTEGPMRQPRLEGSHMLLTREALAAFGWYW